MSSAAKQGTSAVSTGTLPRVWSVAIMRASSTVLPEDTTSTGSERQAGKNG
jgi:hypothetical protein